MVGQGRVQFPQPLIRGDTLSGGDPPSAGARRAPVMPLTAVEGDLRTRLIIPLEDAPFRAGRLLLRPTHVRIPNDGCQAAGRRLRPVESLIAAVREQEEAARFLAWPSDFDLTEAIMSRKCTSPRAPGLRGLPVMVLAARSSSAAKAGRSVRSSMPAPKEVRLWLPSACTSLPRRSVDWFLQTTTPTCPYEAIVIRSSQ